jgi:hypothetical protein
MGKEADIIRRAATLVHPPWSEREVAESSINVYAHDPREMCET